MAVGYHGMVYTVAVLPAMLAAGRGHIINISSSAGRWFVSPGDAAYAAAKAAVDGFTQTLGLELQAMGVRTTVVCLRLVEGADFLRKQVHSSQMPKGSRQHVQTKVFH
ncbi:MAG: hypothetical protein Fur0016_02760 [Anaerolineales bacterium]